MGGGGIDKICDGFTAKGFTEPVFEHNSGGVLCTLYRKDTAALFAGNEDVTLGQNVQKTVEKDTGMVTEKVTENQAVILNEIERNCFVTAQQLSEILHISLRKTKENISKLKEKGLIRRIGADKGGHWEIVLQ